MRKVLILFAVAIIYGCNDPQLVEPKFEISDQMLIDLNTALVKNWNKIDEAKANQLFSNYDSFDDFIENASKSELKRMESIFAFNDQIIYQIFGKRKLSETEFTSVKSRFLELVKTGSKSDPSGRVVLACDDICTEYSMQVWFDRFNAMQDAGADMYEAVAYANAARYDSYFGCMHGCVQVSGN